MTQVRLIVDPLSIYKSGAPIISVDGSVRYEKFFVFGILFFVFTLRLTPVSFALQIFSLNERPIR